jgi:hypothetical protein
MNIFTKIPLDGQEISFARHHYDSIRENLRFHLLKMFSDVGGGADAAGAGVKGEK